MGYFLSFRHPLPPRLKSWKIRILKKKKKKNCWRYHHLHMCIKKDNHMRYGSWDTEWDRQKFLSFWASFCLFTLLSQKNSFSKNKMSISRCHHFTHLYQKSRYYVCFLRYGVQQKIFCDFKQFFALLPNYWPQKLKFGKKCKKLKKIPGDIIL